MEQIFEAILRTSLSGSVIILVILGLRLVLKNTPKRFICLLWMLAVLRLLIPVSIESPLSLQPNLDDFTAPQPDHSIIQNDIPADPMVPANPVSPPSPGTDVVIGDTVIEHPDIVMIDTASITAAIWATVSAGFLAYTAVSYFLLKRKVRDAVQLDDGIYECSAIDTPFLLGYLNPSIYLPAGIPLADLDHILAHERSHIRRMDNWTKLLMFLCLSAHWFNPLVWAAYILLCRDIEMACDEDVITDMEVSDRKAYSTALLHCAAGHRLISVCPVAFGEASVKQRIPRVLNYRKPAFLLGLVAVVTIAIVAVCFLTDPVTPTPEEDGLAQCRGALEAWQNMDSRHLRVDRKFEGGEVLNDSSSTDFWRSGDRYLRISFVPLSGSYRQTNHIYTDGKLLTRQYSGATEGYGFWASEWEVSDAPVSILYSWVDTFDWDAHSIQYVSSQTDGEMTVITLSVTEDPAQCGEDHQYSENPYTVSFSFAADGSLAHIVQTDWAEYETTIDGQQERGIQWTISTYRLVPEEPERIVEEVNHWYTNIQEDFE